MEIYSFSENEPRIHLEYKKNPQLYMQLKISQWQGGMIWPEVKWSYSYHPNIDYFPIMSQGVLFF